MNASIGLLGAMLIAVLGLCEVAAAQDYDRDNAADVYAQARKMMSRLTDEQWEHLFMSLPGERRQEPTAQLRAVLREMQPVLELVRRASNRQYNDLNLDYSQGFELILPHLAQNRQLTRLMASDVMVRIHDGESNVAAERLGALYRMGSHTSEDDILISSLVGASIFSLTDKATEFAMDRGVLTGEDAAVLLKAVQDIHTEDSMHFRQGVVNEKEMMLNWVGEKFGGENGGAEFLQAFGEMVGPAAGMQQFELATMTPDQMAVSLDEAGEAYDRALEIFDMEDREAAQAEMALLTEEIARGDFGVVAAMVMPAMGRILEYSFKLEDQLNERETMLLALVSGEATAKELANAAVWYLRAASMLEKLPAESRNGIMLCASDPEREVSESLATALSDASNIIDTLREGSLLGRCDFTITEQNRPAIQLTHVKSMRELFRLVHADAVRLMQAGEFEDSLDRLRIGYRMIAHLSQDKAIISSLVSHVTFRHSRRVLDLIMMKHALDAPQLAAVHYAVSKLPVNDPFAYMTSIRAQREEAISVLQSRPGYEVKKKLRTLTSTWDGEQLLYVTAFAEVRPVGETKQTADYGWLADVLFTEAIRPIAGEVEAILEELAEGQYDIFENRAVPIIGQIDRWRSVAPRDVAEVLEVAAPMAAEEAEAENAGG